MVDFCNLPKAGLIWFLLQRIFERKTACGKNFNKLCQSWFSRS